jgi:PTS system N-acetylglucosamine-specific IIC component
MVIMNVLNIRLGFSFSAGLFDYVLNFSRATHPFLLIPVGLAYSAVYYVVFRYCIAKFDLKTPGREPASLTASSEASRPIGNRDRAQGFITALGGAGNLTTIDACTTRLRLGVNDQSKVDAEALKRLGAQGIVRPSASALQVILGPIADQVAGEIRSGLRGSAADLNLLRALGGGKNIKDVELASTRLRVRVADGASVDEAAIRSMGLRGVARPSPDFVHLLVGPSAKATHESLMAALTAGDTSNS